MKQKLLFFIVVLFYFLAGNAQINLPRTSHDSLSCDDDLINPACNFIVNPGFRSTGDSLEDFSDGNVFMWQDVNNLTSDINGALATGMGWNLPAVPSILYGTNYASMLIDNYNKETEGISGRTFPLEDGKKYALSFFLASSALGSYRTYGGSYKLKIFLAHCQNFGTSSSENPVITGQTRLIYCKSFEYAGDVDWQQYLVSFTADDDYNMIVVYPELPNNSPNAVGGTYVHFLYPELIPVNPTNQYVTYFVPGWTDTTDINNPVVHPDSTKGYTVLSACGVINGSYQWEGPNGIVSNELNDILPFSTSIGENDQYTFSMWVDGAIGNDPESCDDDEPPLITETSTQLQTTEVMNWVNCNASIPPSTCNMIPNPTFSYTPAVPPVFPGAEGHSAFWYGRVPNWTHISYTTPDIVTSGISSVPPFPSAINALGTPVMSAGLSMAKTYEPTSGGSSWYEGIAAKTQPICAGTKYMFSFFVSSRTNGVSTPVSLNVVLTNCQDLTTVWNYPNAIVPPLVIQGNSQVILCQNPQADYYPWAQYVVTFTATHDFDMVVIYPEFLDPTGTGYRYLQILYPELVNVDNLINITNDGSGQTILNACGVLNATYEWLDDNNVVVGTTSQIIVGAGINPESYSLNVCVPNVLNNPTLTNNCSTNVGCISGLTLQTTVWTGVTSGDWNDASNWNTGIVPNSYTTNVYIPPSTPNSPKILYQTPTQNEIQVNNITLAQGATMINNGLLKIARSISADAASIDNYYTDPSSVRILAGSIEMNGTCAPQTIAGNVFVTNDVKNFTASNNVTISSTATEGLDVHGELSFGITVSKTLSTGNNLTLVSTATGTANVAQIDPSNFIDGDVTVERYINTGTGAVTNDHAAKWQALATPTGANSIGQTVKQSWMENGLSTTTANGYGANIPDPRSTWFSLGFDQQAANNTTAIKTYNSGSNSFDQIANTGIPLYNKNGYFLLVRGDRSKTTIISTPNPTNLRSKGALFQPHTNYTPPSITVPATVPGSPTVWKFEMIGNPYASPISIDYMKNNNFTNLTNDVIVWDPLLAGSQGLGGYQTLHASTGYKPTPGGTALYDVNTAYPDIQSGQAFFVGTPDNSTTGLVTFDEAVKSTNYRLVTRQGDITSQRSFKANLYYDEKICDGNAVIFDNIFNNNIDVNDAGKFLNPGENFMLNRSGHSLSVETRQPVLQSDTIFYEFNNLKQTNYKLRFAAENLQNEELYAVLIDNYLHKRNPLSLADSTFIDFFVDRNKESYTNRFMVVFEKKGANINYADNKVDEATISIYPNPAKDKIINLHYSKMPTGRYNLQLLNLAGQVIHNSSIRIIEPEGSQLIKPGKKVAFGNYELVMISENGRKYILQIIL